VASDDNPAVEAGIRACLDAGDVAAAATAAIRGFGPSLLGYLAAILRDADDANEVFSTVCEDLWRGMAGFRGEASVRTWAYRIAWHAAARHLRSPYRKKRSRLETTQAGKLAAEVRTTTALHLRQASKDALAEMRAALDPEDQTLLVLRVDRDLPWDEIARVLAGDEAPVSAAVLRKRFERLKDRLRDEARARGLIS
jgi:RNA polymerase sigma-70 factor (ECF subfamily)